MSKLQLVTDAENELQHEGEEFIFRVQELHASDGLTVGECVPVCGQPPPDFQRFIVTMQIPIGERRHHSGAMDPIVIQHRFHVPAADVGSAFTMARSMLKSEAEKAQAEARNQVFRKKVLVPSGFNGKQT